MNELSIRQKIYQIRGQRVMLDRDDTTLDMPVSPEVENEPTYSRSQIATLKMGRGQHVMLDFDLAAAYGVDTAQLKRQVRRNIERFEGEDFMFEVSHDELMRYQIGTSSWGGSRYGAFAFILSFNINNLKQNCLS